MEKIGMENAVNSYQIPYKGWKMMLREHDVMTTQEACQYLRISRPTFLKYLYLGRIKGAKAGKGWKVLRSELDRFLKGEISSNMMR
jgi:excisionase family DNA binding protein